MKTKVIIILSFLLICGCSRKVSIGEILENPREYADKEVVIEGEVVDRFSLILVSYFTVDDGTGSIRVITDRPLPNKGNIISVEGTVIYYSFADKSIFAIKETTDF